MITMKFTNTMIMNIRKPTMASPPITNCPKAAITLPAYPLESIPRVVETFSDNRSTVVSSRTVGNTENSSASLMNMVITRMIRLSEMLSSIRKSSSQLGSGIMMAMTMNITNSTNELFSIFRIIPSSPLCNILSELYGWCRN